MDSPLYKILGYVGGGGTLMNKVKVFEALEGTLSPTGVGHKVKWKSIDPETSSLNQLETKTSGLVDNYHQISSRGS